MKKKITAKTKSVKICSAMNVRETIDRCSHAQTMRLLANACKRIVPATRFVGTGSDNDTQRVRHDCTFTHTGNNTWTPSNAAMQPTHLENRSLSRRYWLPHQTVIRPMKTVPYTHWAISFSQILAENKNLQELILRAPDKQIVRTQTPIIAKVNDAVQCKLNFECNLQSYFLKVL